MGERKLLFLMNQEQAQGFGWLVAAANRGDGAAACILGDMYREGLGGLRYSPKETVPLVCEERAHGRCRRAE